MSIPWRALLRPWAVVLTMSVGGSARGDEGGPPPVDATRSTEKGVVRLPTDVARPAGFQRGGSAGGRFALLVGVRDFADPAWPPLAYTEQDAIELGGVLAERGGFATQVVVGAQATRAAFDEAFTELEALQTQPQDTVVIYLSTHGTLEPASGGVTQVLAVADTKRDEALSTGLVLGDVLARFEKLPSRRKVLILATCYSGVGKSSLGEAARRYLANLKGPVDVPLFDVSEASVVLSASAHGEPAREDPSLRHDVYTHFLLEALRGVDLDGDGATSVTEAHDFAREATYRFTAGAQRPTALLAVTGSDPIVLTGRRARAGKPMVLAYERRFEGHRLRIDGQSKGALPAAVALEPGWHEVELLPPASDATSARAVTQRQRVYVDAGEQVGLDVLLEREPPMRVSLAAVGERWPATDRGRPVWMGGAKLVAQRSLAPLRVSLVAAAGLGVGEDTLTINQERFGASLLGLSASGGVSAGDVFGRVGWELRALAGCGLQRRDVASDVFRDIDTILVARVELGAAVRLRLSSQWSASADVGALYFAGDRAGWGASSSLGLGWSF